MDTDAPSSVGNDGGAAPGAAAGTSSSSSSSKPSPRATAIITIGMAGSGKSTFVSRLAADQHQAGKSGPPPYVVNLDPAVGEVGYHANVDVRDTVDYARVMEQ